MDKTNVIIKIPGMLFENESYINIDEKKLVEKTIALLQDRKHIVNVLLKSDNEKSEHMTETLAKVEILLADETGNFNYYEN